MNREELQYAIDNFNAPLYVFDLDIMRETIGVFREKMADKSGLCFAIKANPFLISYMAPIVDRIEVCSMGEFRICKALGINPAQLLISGVLKKKEDILEILEYCGGQCSYTAESPIQFSYFEEWCKQHPEDEIRVYPRLSSGNQFGMDEQTIVNLIKISMQYPNLTVKGIHYFSGTQKKKIKKVYKELEMLKEVFARVEAETQYTLDELEYGSGLAFPYFEGQDDNRLSDLEGMVDAIEQCGWSNRITVEMGRALAANCGYYMTNVLDMKSIGDRNYCIVDGGMQHINYDGQIRGMYIPRYQVTANQTEGELVDWTVCGALCTANDVLLQKVSVANLQIGDVFIFENTGAYAMTEGMSLFLSHPLPKVLVYSKQEGFTLLRDTFHTFMLNTVNN